MGQLPVGAAVDSALALGIERIWNRARDLGEALRARLAALPGVTVRDLGVVRGGMVSFTVQDVGRRHPPGSRNRYVEALRRK